MNGQMWIPEVEKYLYFGTEGLIRKDQSNLLNTHSVTVTK
jgi:hypothetical protein